MEEYVDTHCHLFDTRGADLDEVIAGARAAGVTTMINVGCDAATGGETGRTLASRIAGSLGSGRTTTSSVAEA